MLHQSAKVKNPILRGFNPDPAICRAGDTYFIATSTFEWYPGVQIFSSRDLKTWELAARPLNEARLLDMRGVPDSGGVWAPCLTFADNQFWLVFTAVRRLEGNFKDTPNFVVTAPTIDGPWSDPVYLNSSGFDPSLFHDDDGRKWLSNMVWDHRPDRTPFAGIVLQEYDPKARQLIGEPKTIFTGSELGLTEGPHIYKRDGWYYLLTAEGGTGYDHAMTVARSRSLEGPYEIDPNGHLLTAKDDPDHPLQRIGHGGIVETPDGRVFTTFLCSRPLTPRGPCPIGRETGLQEITYRDGWYRTLDGNPRARLMPFDGGAIEAVEHVHYQFTADALPADFQWLRVPDPAHLFSLTARPGHLRLYGRESVGSLYDQALVARRRTEPVYSAEVTMDYAPSDFQHMAGLITYYNSRKFHYLYVSHDNDLGRHLNIMSCNAAVDQKLDYPAWNARLKLPEAPLRLGVEVDGLRQQFFVAIDGGQWQPFGPVLDAGILSDQSGNGDATNFTGTFVGMCAQDLTGTGRHADFADFVYRATPITDQAKAR